MLWVLENSKQALNLLVMVCEIVVKLDVEELDVEELDVEELDLDSVPFRKIIK